MVTVGLGFTVKTLEAVAVHPLESVTVTTYVPAVLIVILCVVAELLHKYVYGLVPPLGFAVKTDELPKQII